MALAALKIGGRTVPRPAAIVRAEAERFLKRQGCAGSRVYRVEAEGPGITWILFVTAMSKARYVIVAGESPSTWELLNEGSGWPVV